MQKSYSFLLHAIFVKKLKEDFCCEISLHRDMHLCTIKEKFQEKIGCGCDKNGFETK